MVGAEPVKGVAYRKSQRSQQAFEEANMKGPSLASRVNSIAAPAPTQTPVPTPATRRSGTTPELDENRTPLQPIVPATSEPAPKRRRARAPEVSPETRTDGPSRSARTAALSVSPADTPTGRLTPTLPEGEETIGITLESTTEIRAPAGTIIDAEAQIAQSKADILRLKAEAEARAAAGESPVEMGLVQSTSTASSTVIDAAHPDQPRGTKRTAARQAQDEATEVTGSTAVLPGSVAETVIRRRQGRIVQPEQARRRAGVMGAVMFGVGAVGAWAWQNLL
jgi:hypothetical protein